MMSSAEVREIDDWRFGKRVNTRSDAVRRLCQVGLVYDRSFRDHIAVLKSQISELGELDVPQLDLLRSTLQLIVKTHDAVSFLDNLPVLRDGTGEVIDYLETPEE